MKRIILLISLGCFVVNLWGQGFLEPIDTVNALIRSMNVNELAKGNLLFSANTTINNAGTHFVDTTQSDFANINYLTNDGKSINQFDVDISRTSFVFSLNDDSFILIGDGFPEDTTSLSQSSRPSQINASRYSKDGMLIWSEEYSEVGSNVYFNRVTGAFQANDGVLIFGNKINTLSGNPSDIVFPFLIKINNNGILQWEVLLDERGAFFSELNQGDFNQIDTIKLIANDKEYQIDMDGNIISEILLVENIGQSDLPYTYDDYFISAESKTRLEVDDGEILLQSFHVNTSYYDTLLQKEINESYRVQYLSKFDNDRNRIWLKEIGITSKSERGKIRLLPNGNIIYFPGDSFGEILTLDANNGDIVGSDYLFGTGNKLDLFSIIEKGGYFMYVGTNSSNNEIVFFKVGYDLKAYDVEKTNLPNEGYFLLRSVKTLSNDQYAGMGFTYNGVVSTIFAFRADKNGVMFSNEINGSVIGDLNNNCQVDSLDINLSDWDIIATGTQEFRTTTNQDGSYTMQVDTGEYQISIIPKNDYWLNCDTTKVEFTSFFDTLTNIDLIISAITPCSFIEVDVGFGALRRCFSNRVVVQYCNQGTFAEEEAVVELNIDSFLDVDMTSIPIANQVDTTLFFDIGTVGVGECGKFNIWVTPNCDNTVLGQEHCINAHVFPDTLCVPQDSLWSGANVVVEAICEGDSTLFKLINIGNAPTKDDLAYIVIVDDIIVSRDGTYSLEAGATIEFVEYEPGSTIKVIAEQEPFHPLGNQVGVEAFCAGTDFDFISSFNQFDDDPFTDIVCVENRGSYDPNDKSAIPLGAGAEHYISSAQDLEYKIRFQNTGTDTAFTVVIRDTIASELDMSTFEAGIGSHDYTVAIEEGNILIFTFDNILLPDSTTNLVESNGFVEFKIDQVDGNLPETVIENTAAIFFDFNDPIITNTVFHTIETPVTFSIMNVDVCANEMYEQVLYSNDTTISVLHASSYLDSFAIVKIHLLPVDSTIQFLDVEYGTTINNTLITMDTIMYEVFTNSVGCDSILVRDITIENVNAVSLIDKSHWEVFPNPTKGRLSIATSQAFTDDVYTVSLMNIVGVSVYEQDHRISPNDDLSLELRSLPAGTYLLNISSKHGMITEKVIINP